MGKNGYGPVHYYHLLKSKAFSLNPKLVIAAVYLGNDLMDAFNSAYARPYWAKLRNPEMNYSPKDQSNFIFHAPSKSTKRFPKLRAWLSKHSVLYTASKAIFQKQVREFLFQKAKQEDRFTIIENAKHHLIFSPGNTLALLNLEDERIREGMRISLQVLLDMSLLCQQNKVPFLVVLIPTKEIIYAEYIEHQPHLPHSDTIDKLLSSQRKVIQTFQSFLEDHEIRYTNIGVHLRQVKEEHTLYPPHNDAHFNGEGYTVIAQILTKLLKEDERLLRSGLQASTH